jgi:hypothetical protein
MRLLFNCTAHTGGRKIGVDDNLKMSKTVLKLADPPPPSSNW